MIKRKEEFMLFLRANSLLPLASNVINDVENHEY